MTTGGWREYFRKRYEGSGRRCCRGSLVPRSSQQYGESTICSTGCLIVYAVTSLQPQTMFEDIQKRLEYLYLNVRTKDPSHLHVIWSSLLPCVVAKRRRRELYRPPGAVKRLFRSASNPNRYTYSPNVDPEFIRHGKEEPEWLHEISCFSDKLIAGVSPVAGSRNHDVGRKLQISCHMGSNISWSGTLDLEHDRCCLLTDNEFIRRNWNLISGGLFGLAIASRLRQLQGTPCSHEVKKIFGPLKYDNHLIVKKDNPKTEYEVVCGICGGLYKSLTDQYGHMILSHKLQPDIILKHFLVYKCGCCDNIIYPSEDRSVPCKCLEEFVPKLWYHISNYNVGGLMNAVVRCPSDDPFLYLRSRPKSGSPFQDAPPELRRTVSIFDRLTHRRHHTPPARRSPTHTTLKTDRKLIGSRRRRRGRSTGASPRTPDTARTTRGSPRTDGAAIGRYSPRSPALPENPPRSVAPLSENEPRLPEPRNLIQEVSPVDAAADLAGAEQPKAILDQIVSNPAKVSRRETKLGVSPRGPGPRTVGIDPGVQAKEEAAAKPPMNSPTGKVISPLPSARKLNGLASPALVTIEERVAMLRQESTHQDGRRRGLSPCRSDSSRENLLFEKGRLEARRRAKASLWEQVLQGSIAVKGGPGNAFGNSTTSCGSVTGRSETSSFTSSFLNLTKTTAEAP